MSLQVRCPHCDHSNELQEETSFKSVACASCGNSFSLVNDNTLTYADSETRSIGHFELIESIGSGAFGAVWKARDTQLDRTVAIKIPVKGQLSAEEGEKFLREARAGAQLQHPNIVPVHEVGREGDTVYIVSDFVEGITLSHWLTAKRATPREAAELCAKVAEAMHHAHEAGVIHRDLKPSNIMFGHDGEPRVMDFGLARREAGEITMTVEGKVLGTPAYMSPEQAKGEAHSADRRTDIYALGVILFELLTGERPFRGSTQMLLHQVIHDEPRSPRTLNPLAPRDLDTICLKCLEKDPNRRYDTAKDLADELHCFLRGEPIQARAIGRTERAWRWCKRHPAVAGLSALVLLVLVGGVAISMLFAFEANRRAESESEAKLWAQAEGQRATGLANDKSRIIEALRDYVYAADMRTAQAMIDQGDTAQALNLLNRYLPVEDQPDQRGFAWEYLRHRCRHAHGAVLENISRFDGIAVTPDGQQLVHVAGNDVSQGTIGLCQTTTGTARWQTIQEQFLPSDVSISPDGHFLAVAGAAGAGDKAGYRFHGVLLGDLRDNPPKLRALVHPLSDKKSIGRCVAFSPDGQTLACGAPDGAIELWNYQKQKRIARLIRLGRDVDKLVFNLDGSLLVAASYGDIVDVWDVKERQRLVMLERDAVANPFNDLYYRNSHWRCRPVALALSPDGRLLATAANGPTIRLYDLANRTRLVEWTGHTDAVSALAFSPDGRSVVSASIDHDVRLWDVKTGTEIRLGSHHGVVNAVLLSRDGKYVLSAGDDAALRRWKVPDADEPPESFEGSRSFIYGLAFSPDGRTLASGGWHYQIPLREVATGKLIQTLRPFNGRVHSLAFSLDGSRVFCANTDEQCLDVWDRESGKRTVLTKEEFSVGVLSLSPDGSRVAVGDHPPSKTNLYQSSSGQLLKRLPGGNPHFSPDGRWLFLYDEHAMWLCDATTLERVHRIDASSPQLSRMPAFSRHGRLFAFKDANKVITVWDVEKQSILHRLTGNWASVTALAFCPDGRTFASAEGERVVLWDLVTGERLATLHGHGAAVTTLAFSPDGRVLASAGLDKRIHLWRASGGANGPNVATEADIIARAENFKRVAR